MKVILSDQKNEEKYRDIGPLIELSFRYQRVS